MSELIHYLITFLLHGKEEAAASVGYTDNTDEWSQYKVVIRPNGHLAHDWVLPDLRTPVFTPVQGTKTLLIETDILYNTLFFTSRAEETLVRQRDEHGRFVARYSLLGNENRLMIPLVDEYSRLLLKALDLTMPTKQFDRIYLTHDIDTIAYYRSLRGALGGIRRGEWQQVKRAWHSLNDDPAYTFPWLIQQDSRVSGATAVYFAKDTHGKGYDYPQFCLHGRDWRETRRLLEDHHAIIGLHSGYDGYLPPHDRAGIHRQYHRSHYLRCSIEQMQRLADAGIEHDFTMGFPDQAGFRLQTSRPIRWFNPVTMRLTRLTLHPLIVMDATLHRQEYMHLSEDEAYFYCQELFDRVRLHHGELTLLWHNSNINGQTYHKSLYPKLLQLL